MLEFWPFRCWLVVKSVNWDDWRGSMVSVFWTLTLWRRTLTRCLRMCCIRCDMWHDYDSVSLFQEWNHPKHPPFMQALIFWSRPIDVEKGSWNTMNSMNSWRDWWSCQLDKNFQTKRRRNSGFQPLKVGENNWIWMPFWVSMHNLEGEFLWQWAMLILRIDFQFRFHISSCQRQTWFGKRPNFTSHLSFYLNPESKIYTM